MEKQLNPNDVRPQLQLITLLSSGLLKALPPEVSKIGEKIQKCLLYDKTADVLCFVINTFNEKEPKAEELNQVLTAYAAPLQQE